MKAYKVFFSLLALFIVLLVFILFNGCSNSESPQSGNFALSFSQSKQMAKAQSDTLFISSVKILIKNLKLKSTESDSLKESGEGDDDNSVELKYGPFIVPLNLNGNLSTITVNSVPAGTYTAAEFEIHKLGENETPPDSDFTDGTKGDERYSIVVKGTYNGSPFIYKSQLEADQRVVFQNPVVVSNNGFVNVTLVVDPYSWFNFEGRILNPLDITNTIVINNLIRASFRQGFEDNNEDGHGD